MNSLKEKLTEKLPVLVTLLIALQVLTFVYVVGSKSQVEQTPAHGYGYSVEVTSTGSVEKTQEQLEKKTELQKITESVLEEKVVEEVEVVSTNKTKEDTKQHSIDTSKNETVVNTTKTTPVIKVEEKVVVKTVVDTPKKEEVKTEKVVEVKPTPAIPKVETKVESPKVEKPKAEVKPLNKTETKKEVMLAPEKTIVVNGEVVVRSGNEDYRDLEEEKMIEDVLSSGQSQRITSYEMLEVVDKRTGPTIRYVEETTPVVGDRDLAEEAMLDAVLNAGL